MPRGGKRPGAGSGGARPGAGRPKGAANRRTREIADKAAAEGITPLEVMLKAMMEHYDAKEYTAAAAIAKDAAPYIHPRLASVEQKHSGDINVGRIDAPAKETREEWLARQQRVGTAAGAAVGGNPGNVVH